MKTPALCTSLDEIRSHIDTIDRSIVVLIAERAGFVMQAARFKRTTDDVKAPQRVERVISRVRALSQEVGVNPEIVEATYRAMISAFINAGLAQHATLAPND